MAEYGEWNRKGATLSDVTARKKYGVSRDFIVKGNRAGQPSLTRLACIPVLFSLLQLQVFAQTLRDDFVACSVGSDGGPAWEPQSATWETEDGTYLGDSGISLWRAVPFASAMTFACDVTVLEFCQEAPFLNVDSRRNHVRCRFHS